MTINRLQIMRLCGKLLQRQLEVPRLKVAEVGSMFVAVGLSGI